MKVCLLGATSRISSYLIPQLLQLPNITLTLFGHNVTHRLAQYQGLPNVQLINGDFCQVERVTMAVQQQQIVFLATATNPELNRQIVLAMHTAKCQRLIIAGVLGIENELSGAFKAWNYQMLGDAGGFKSAAQLLFNGGLTYTYLRMAWLYNQPANESYQVIPSGQPVKGTQASRQAIAALITRISQQPRLYENQSIAVVEPQTEWAKPSFY